MLLFRSLSSYNAGCVGTCKVYILATTINACIILLNWWTYFKNAQLLCLNLISCLYNLMASMMVFYL